MSIRRQRVKPLMILAPRDPDLVAKRWDLFQKLIDANKTFEDAVRYMRRYTRCAKAFAKFVSYGPTVDSI